MIDEIIDTNDLDYSYDDPGRVKNVKVVKTVKKKQPGRPKIYDNMTPAESHKRWREKNKDKLKENNRKYYAKMKLAREDYKLRNHKCECGVCGKSIN